MGMAASQARLLGITSRMNDIEFKSQQVSNIKIRLADDSEKVANAYTQALNKQKFTMTSFASGKAVKTDVTIASLNAVGSTMKLCARNGKQVVSKSQAEAYKAALNDYNSPHYSWTADTHANHFQNSQAVYGLMMKFGVTSFAAARQKFGITEGGGWESLVKAGKVTQEEVDAFNAQYESMFANSTGTHFNGSQGSGSMNPDAIIVLDDSALNSANWLQQAVESGEFYIADLSGTEVSVSSNVSLAIESDNSDFAKAEAEYNAATAKINKKEKQLDNEMKALDTEHQALKTEQDSVKSLIGENVEKSFNLFS